MEVKTHNTRCLEHEIHIVYIHAKFICFCRYYCIVFSTGSHTFRFVMQNCMFTLQNKKQRKMVREAVLKSKDPQRILEEIEKIETLGKAIYLLLK